MSRWFAAAALLGLILISGCAAPETTLSREMVISRSSPGVVKIYEFGDFEGTVPHQAVTRKEYVAWSFPTLERYRWLAPPAPSLVHNAFKRDRDAGVIPDSTSEGQYCWRKIAEDPGQFLQTAGAPDTLTLSHQLFASGSGFVVSRDGTLLTNAHVISDPDGMPISLVVDAATRTIESLRNEFGEDPPQELQDRLGSSLLKFLAANSSGGGKRTELRVVSGVERSSIWDRIPSSIFRDHPDPEADEAERIQRVSTEAQVLAQGVPYPGKDVAVLKVDLKDRLICLPLGDSDDVFAGTLVHAMGFPGAAVDQENMTPEAGERVISNDGEVDQRLPLKEDWEAFHMTANINHGDSGGPVIDQYGRVIAINVAGNDAAGQRLAVPINIAREFLKQSGVTPEPGPATEHWLAGQRAFWQQHYSEAKAEFEKTARIENGGMRLGSLAISMGWSTDAYVSEMIDRCTKKIAAGKDRGGLHALLPVAATCVGGLILLAIVGSVISAVASRAPKEAETPTVGT